MTCEKFESVMGYHCSPVLMGMKPANLVSFSKEKMPELPEIICGCRKHYLLLVYRPDMLQEYLKQDEAKKLLLQDVYNIDSSLDEMIARLKERFFHKTEFPHEIGLFLGYPIEDVKGFRKFGGSGCKMCGYWKVYDDVEQARRIFDSYDKCREFTAAQIRAGYSILQVVGMKHLCTSQMCV